MVQKVYKYIDYLNEISGDQLYEGLLGYGLFSKNIPNFLTSKLFYDFYSNNYCKNKNNPNIIAKGYIKYESIRNINIPRILAIPNPICYGNLCYELSINWDELKGYFKETTKNQLHKISRIHIRKIKNRYEIFQGCYDDTDVNEDDRYEFSINACHHLFEMNHKDFCIDDFPEPDLLIGNNYIVKADISNCFPSIYTHVIPWALMGKQKAKNNRNDKTDYRNRIDILTRNLKHGETNGILIGPHASNLISEIILVKIDEELYKNEYRYIRKIDDYTCYVKDYNMAEKFLIDLATALKKYDLSLNHKKTEILKLPQASYKDWVRKIKSFVFSDELVKLNTVRSFLDISLELMEQNHENTAILNYAIKILSRKKLTVKAKDYFLKTIHYLILIYPYLIQLLDEKIFEVFKVDEVSIKKVSEDIFTMAEPKNLYEAMSYALYFAIKYNFNIYFNKNLFEIAKNSKDTILMLLAYLHDKKFNYSKREKAFIDLAKNLKNDIDEFWLFVYEVLTEKDLDDYWKEMKKNNVSFIKSDFIYS